MKHLCLGQHLNRRQRHRHANFHVQCSRPPQTPIGNAAWHGAQSADRPHCIQMPKQQDWPLPIAFATCTEPHFQNITVLALPVQFNASAQSTPGFGCKGDAGIHSLLHIRRRFNLDEPPCKLDQRCLFATRTGQQCSHGNFDIRGLCCLRVHW